jgi:hypothetical protein
VRYDAGDPRDFCGRERGDERPRVYDDRDRGDNDPRDGRGQARELVVGRDRVYELDGEDSHTVAAVAPFGSCPSTTSTSTTTP